MGTWGQRVPRVEPSWEPGDSGGGGDAGKAVRAWARHPAVPAGAEAPSLRSRGSRTRVQVSLWTDAPRRGGTLGSSSGTQKAGFQNRRRQVSAEEEAPHLLDQPPASFLSAGLSHWSVFSLRFPLSPTRMHSCM